MTLTTDESIDRARLETAWYVSRGICADNDARGDVHTGHEVLHIILTALTFPHLPPQWDDDGRFVVRNP